MASCTFWCGGRKEGEEEERGGGGAREGGGTARVSRKGVGRLKKDGGGAGGCSRWSRHVRASRVRKKKTRGDGLD